MGLYFTGVILNYVLWSVFLYDITISLLVTNISLLMQLQYTSGSILICSVIVIASLVMRQYIIHYYGTIADKFLEGKWRLKLISCELILVAPITLMEFVLYGINTIIIVIPLLSTIFGIVTLAMLFFKLTKMKYEITVPFTMSGLAASIIAIPLTITLTISAPLSASVVYSILLSCLSVPINSIAAFLLTKIRWNS